MTKSNIKKLTSSAKVFINTELIVLQAVADGTKPTALIPDIFEEEVKESGLYYQKNSFGILMVAKSKEKLDEISNLTIRFDELHKELGIKLGYPLTAVQAFVGKIKSKDDDAIPIEYQCFFSFSQDHFADEIKVIDQWYKSAKKKFDAEMRP